MINYFFRYFTLNRRERNGMMALVSLVFMLLVCKYGIIYHYRLQTSQALIVELDELAANLTEENKETQKEN